MKRSVIQTAVIVCLLASLCNSPIWAADAALDGIQITHSKDNLLISFHVTNCMAEEMKMAIDNGINTTFNFVIKLYRVKKLWWDKKIVALKVSHDIQYDTLKKLYMVRLSEGEGKVILVQDFEEAKKLMSEIVALKLVSLSELEKGSRYKVRMMAELDKIRLPFYLHYILFFLSLWDFQTDWYTINFTF